MARASFILFFIEILSSVCNQHLSFRFAAVFTKLGVKYGDCVHILTGNNSFTFIAMYAAFYLGAFASAGDVELDAETIAGQVRTIFLNLA